MESDNSPAFMWGGVDGRGGTEHHRPYSLMAAPTAARLTDQLFSPSKAGGGGSAIPEEFLRPPQQTFGDFLVGNGQSQSQNDTSLHEEVDIKPVILPAPPTSSPPKPSDSDDIDILMDDLLKDVETNLLNNPQASSSSPAPQKPAGLMIRKDIFASSALQLHSQSNMQGQVTPKKEPAIIDIGVGTIELGCEYNFEISGLPNKLCQPRPRLLESTPG